VSHPHRRRRLAGPLASQAEQLLAPEPPPDIKDLAAQYLVLVTCRDEKDQIELLGRLKEKGRECKAFWRDRKSKLI
jgi:hypothetical protein